MTDYAVKHMSQAAEVHDRRAEECRTRAADYRASAEVEEGRATKEEQRAADLRAAVAKLTADDTQWTKDDLARFHAEGLAALEPNTLVPHPGANAVELLAHNDRSHKLYRALLVGDQPDRDNRAAAVDVRAFQPDGDTYGSDFVEPHLG